MAGKMVNAPMLIEVFSTCPQASPSSYEYIQKVIDVSRWSEECNCAGILVYTDNSQLDPWLVSQIIIQSTRKLCPLVAVQPAYMHPYAVAKMIASIGYLYGRRVLLNMVAGGFKNDLAALNDTTPHDKRYARLVEYTTIIKRLLSDTTPLTFRGKFYTVDKLKMTPALPAELPPRIFVSGSSEAGLAAAREIGATAVKYPKPAQEYADDFRDNSMEFGIRVGIIAREESEAAWTVARARFPQDRKGELTHQLAMKISDSAWHKQLSRTEGGNSPYWMLPFETYKTFCPYLVGSYEEVSKELAKYIEVGYQKVILDIPPSQEELRHINICFEKAIGKLPRGSEDHAPGTRAKAVALPSRWQAHGVQALGDLSVENLHRKA
jgi:alkanesulfonate monooxygenase